MDDRAPADDTKLGPGAEDALALLADETRLSILRELYALEEPLTFSELRERVGVRDSGQFNYHLGKLTDQFVERGEDGYELTMAGMRLLGAVFAGSYEGEETIEPIPLDDPCPLCDGELTATYDRDHFKIVCDECETHIVAYPAPPGILRGRDREELPTVFSRYASHVFGQIVDGFCPLCLGPTAPEIGSERTSGIGVNYRCQHCGVEMTMSVSIVLLTEPEVVAFAREHGLELQRAPVWTHNPIFDADERLIDDPDDPAAVELTITMDEESLTARLDDDLSILELTRS